VALGRSEVACDPEICGVAPLCPYASTSLMLVLFVKPRVVAWVGSVNFSVELGSLFRSWAAGSQPAIEGDVERVQGLLPVLGPASSALPRGV